MSSGEHHRCDVFGTPWPGVHGTAIDSARHYGRHWHDSHGIGLLEQGAQRSASGRGSVDAAAGDLITTNHGEVHDGRPLGGPSRRWRIVYLDAGMLGSLTAVPGEPAGDVELTRPVLQDPALRQAMARLFGCLQAWNAGRNRDSAGTLACDEALAAACGLLRQRHAALAPPPEPRAPLGAVRDCLADRLLAPPSLAELASLAGLSRFQLLRRFRQAYGLPPHAWLLQQRVERARGLIRGGIALEQVAADCGFADQSHMTRHFVRQFGFTPGAWQRATAPRAAQ